MKTKKKIKAYWFGTQLGYGDGRIPRKGLTHRVNGHPRLCSHGLHASIHPFDALLYTECHTLWMVELSGEVIKGDNKLVATERTYIKSIDISKVARKFARWCALRVLKNWGAKPPKVVVQYLNTGDEQLRCAAERAAWRAVWRAAESAARSAADSAVWSAAESAAESAARSAAMSAARSAAESAARSAERKAQRRKFKQLVEEAFANAS